jgi:uncharacterized membrane protein
MMTPWYLTRLYLLTALVFLAVDLVWIRVVVSGMYEKQLGHLLRDQPLVGPALLFYAIYVLGILVFAVLPGLETESLRRTVVLGAFLGLLAYATFDLTSMALFKGFSPLVVITDIAWGSILTGSIAAAGSAIGRWLA